MSDVNTKSHWTQSRDTARAQKAAQTRLALIQAARTLFTAQGYHGVGVRDVTAAAGVTRGAFAHHFTDKLALFEAVFVMVEQELTGGAPEGATGSGWERFRAGIQLYLDTVTLRPDVQRITLIDGPAVLGWKRWRDLEERHSLGTLTAMLGRAMAEQVIRARPVEPLAHLILGSVMEAAMLVAHAGNPVARRREIGDALDDFLRGLE
jgi:AcrR family transcriptional regulator